MPSLAPPSSCELARFKAVGRDNEIELAKFRNIPDTALSVVPVVGVILEGVRRKVRLAGHCVCPALRNPRAAGIAQW